MDGNIFLQEVDARLELHLEDHQYHHRIQSPGGWEARSHNFGWRNSTSRALAAAFELDSYIRLARDTPSKNETRLLRTSATIQMVFSLLVSPTSAPLVQYHPASKDHCLRCSHRYQDHRY